MSKLQILYSKELARELGKIAIYLPGEKVNVGDIITFPNGKSILRKPRPIGTFKKITSLKKLGIKYSEPCFSNTPDTYRFSSNNTVNTNLDISSNINPLPNGKIKMKINFTSEGAIYFLAIDCDKKELDDLNSLENEINAKGKEMLWKDTFLVTSVTIAKKAFIAQSRSKKAELLINGDIQGLQSTPIEIGTTTNLSINKQQGDIFIKEWSKDVTVFMDLMRFEKKIFKENDKGIRSSKSKESENKKMILKSVEIDELLKN